MLEIKIDRVDDLKTRLARYPQAAEPALRRAGDEIFERIFRAADHHTKSGALARSLKNSFRGGEYRIWHDTQHAPHAVFVHWGSKKHVIKPKNKKALRWPGPGGFIFAKFVRNHPGYAGDPYFVTEGSSDKIFDAFSRAFAQEIK